jgi:geranylgeranyl pyrophosphate synthase
MNIIDNDKSSLINGKQMIDDLILNYITKLSIDDRLKTGLIYVLMNGKRLRSLITFSLLEKYNTDWFDYRDIILVPEFIHTASLIIDDLPGFDNAKTRRGQKCVHHVYGEGIAYLLSLTLITESTLLLERYSEKLKNKFGTELSYKIYKNCTNNILSNLSGTGAVHGQLLSTFHTNGMKNISNVNIKDMPKMGKEDIRNILIKKTAPFFEISIILPWLISGRDSEKLSDLKQVAELFGLCYQIKDDFEDYSEDCSDESFSHNYLYHVGTETALYDYRQFLENLNNLIYINDLSTPIINDILVSLRF